MVRDQQELSVLVIDQHGPAFHSSVMVTDEQELPVRSPAIRRWQY